MTKIIENDEPLFKILNEIGEIILPADVPALLSRVGHLYGLKTIAYFGSNIHRRSTDEPYLAVTYSQEWIEHYKVQRYVEIDPVIKLGFQRLLPVDWQEFERPKGNIRQFFGEAAEFGLGQHGLSVPVHGVSGDRAILTITSDAADREWRKERCYYMRDFQVLASHIHEMVLRIEGAQADPVHLTRREEQCLGWTAQGKTVWECARILGLSPHTVKEHLARARNKLNATNNTHAVFRAAALGLLI